ncbi:MAG: 30S ribosomal protein S4 [Patescibacteria group bacterium]|nr:30S ribosomal protein S4 [Patescibacteria group bacterium]MDE1940763.1 30S ribosomal protein S4 [Patescibacteria group bacterium]MDE1967125.1 30S ribosomal protein S4 [Patescibacteria group bacterium]
MQIGPRYKKARYLGAPVFRKTQTQKFAMRGEKKGRTPGRRGAKSEYGRQMLEKQKARFSYGVNGRQFTNYVMLALSSPGDNAKNLLRFLESRLDNVVVRAGFAPTRSAARQMVSHGHITVNGRVVKVPSFEARTGDMIAIREGSKSKAIFGKLDEELKAFKWPSWLSVDAAKREIKISAEPSTDLSDLLFDVRQVLEFYTR